MERKELIYLLKLGRITCLQIEQHYENNEYVVLITKRGSAHQYLYKNRYKHPAAALNHLLKLIDIEPIEGLTDTYMAIPAIYVIKHRRPKHETDQHEQALKSPELPQR